MGKPRLRNKRKEYKELSKRLAEYMMQVRTIYDRLNERAASIVESVGYDGAVEFSFADYPETKRDLQLLQKQFVGDMQSLIYSGTSAEWRNSNLLQDLVANKALKFYRAQVAGKKFKHYYQANSEQLKAFQRRRERGLNLSAKLWNQSQVYKDSLEATISTAIEKGMSAVTLSKRISKYLNDWPSLQADYQEKFGKATNCYDCEYRSIRLARNEINIAYRTAEQLRWQQFDFILGYKIKLSGSHPKRDICDDLQGDYPKDFKFVGWHPNCYLPNALVLTDKGWKYIKDVSDNDKVLSLKPETRELEYVGIVARQSFQYQGEIVRFRNRSLDCSVTQDHRMVYLNKSDSRIKYKDASDFNKNMGGFYRGCEYQAEDIGSIDINGEVIQFDLFCEFMGYWLSDGSLMHNHQIVISQQKGEPAYDGILRCISGLGHKPYVCKDVIVFNDSKLNSYLKQFGTCNNKFIPKEITCSSTRQISIFLNAFVKCDGHTRKPKSFVGSHGNVFKGVNEEREFFTTSERLYAGLCELLLKIGKRPSVSVRAPSVTTKRDGSIIKGNYDLYIIRECNSVTATFFTKTTERYDGMVYDLTLERNHIMYIQQNGKCYWGSNCLCYTIPIVMSEDEYWSDDRENSPNMITEPPENFTKWCSDNASRILDAEEKSNLPYFIKDNKTIVYNSDVELYARKYFSKEEIRAFKKSTEVGIYHKAVDVDAIFKKNGFTEEEIKEFQSSIKVHQWGQQDQQFNDSEIAVEMWNEKSRIGSLYRLNADIEETAYKLYRKENPPLRIYRAGTMEKDTLSFTTDPQGVEHIVEGESYRWSPDHVRTVDDMMKEYRLFGGIVNKDIGYAGEKELFFVRRERKYLDMDWFNGEIEKRKQKEIKEALELKGDKLKKYEQISSEYMNMFLSNYTKLSSSEINYFSELGKKATNSDEGLMVISKAYEKLKSLLGL